MYPEDVYFVLCFKSSCSKNKCRTDFFCSIAIDDMMYFCCDELPIKKFQLAIWETLSPVICNVCPLLQASFCWESQFGHSKLMHVACWKNIALLCVIRHLVVKNTQKWIMMTRFKTLLASLGLIISLESNFPWIIAVSWTHKSRPLSEPDGLFYFIKQFKDERRCKKTNS